MNEARLLDTQDRYLNTKCTRYALRANKFELAEDIVNLFLREKEQSVPKSMKELQCSWYEVLCGLQHLALNDYETSVRILLRVAEHYSTFIEDQSNFHYYCVRKMTIRSYVDMLRWAANRVSGDKPHIDACHGLIQGLLQLHSKQLKSKMEQKEEELNKSPEEVEKIRKKYEDQEKK